MSTQGWFAVAVVAAAVKGCNTVSGETTLSEHSYDPSRAPVCKRETHNVRESLKECSYGTLPVINNGR